MGMTKGKDDNAQYMKKGGKKMMTGGMNNPNAKATVKPSMKKGGMYKKGGMKKGM